MCHLEDYKEAPSYSSSVILYLLPKFHFPVLARFEMDVFLTFELNLLDLGQKRLIKFTTAGFQLFHNFCSVKIRWG